MLQCNCPATAAGYDKSTGQCTCPSGYGGAQSNQQCGSSACLYFDVGTNCDNKCTCVNGTQDNLTVHLFISPLACLSVCLTQLCLCTDMTTRQTSVNACSTGYAGLDCKTHLSLVRCILQYNTLMY